MIDSQKAEKIKERLTDRQTRRGYLEQEEMELMEALADLNVACVVLEVKDDTIKFLEERLAEAQQTIETLEMAKEYEIELHAQSCTEYQQTIALKQSHIEMLVGQVTDETTLHAKTAAKLIVAEQTLARQQKALEFYAKSMCIQKEDLGWDVGFIAREALMEIGAGAKEGEKTDG